MVGDLYAAKFVCHISHNANHMYRMLEDMVKEVVIIPREQVSDQDMAAWGAHRQCVLEHTLLRKAHHTRGRLEDPGTADSFAPAWNEAALHKRVALINQMLNGDLTRQCFCHIECGCCDGRADTEKKLVAALVDGVGASVSPRDFGQTRRLAEILTCICCFLLVPCDSRNASLCLQFRTRVSAQCDCSGVADVRFNMRCDCSPGRDPASNGWHAGDKQMGLNGYHKC